MRLIDADSFELNVQSEWERSEISNGDWILIRQLINDAPTIDIEDRLNDAYAHGWSDAEAKYHDSVEVVRCKDCKHWDNEDDAQRCSYTNHGLHWAKPDDFCSYGERRQK